MAHTILGIDLGSDSVKLAHLQAGFRSMQLLGLYEQKVPLPEGVQDGVREPGLLDRQLGTLTEMVRGLDLRPEMVAAALSDGTTLRVLDLPLSDPRKLAQILPFELEGQVIGEIEEQVVDYVVARGGITVEDGLQGQGCRVVAAAVSEERVRELLARLVSAGLDPRVLGASALCGAALFAPAGEPPGSPVFLVDIGRHTVNVCAVEKGTAGLSATFARTIQRGSHMLTQAIARAQAVDLETAERLKLQSDISRRPGGASGDPRVETLIVEALRPLVRDLRQTMASYVSLYGEAPREVFLIGGGALLPGLPEHLSAELSMPVSLMPPLEIRTSAREEPRPLAVSTESFIRCASALGLALSLAMPAPQVNFRRGALAYRTDYSFLRERAPQLATAILCIILCAGLSALAQLHNLKKESEQLTEKLRQETLGLFGEARTDGRAVSQELSQVLLAAKGGGQSVPTISAFDLLSEISDAVPQGDRTVARLDITDLTIRPKKIDIKGTAGSSQFISDLAAALGKISCFKEVEKGKEVSVKNTGPDGKPIDVKQFTLQIKTTCP